MRKNYHLFILLFIASNVFAQTAHYIDDFVTGETRTYTTSTTEYFNSNTEYFGVTDKSTANSNVDITDHNFFGARQITGTPTITYGPYTLTGETNVFVGVGVAISELNTWETSDVVRIQYQIGAGTWTDLLVFSGTGDNTTPVFSGDATSLGNTVEEFGNEITGLAGSESFSIRVQFEGLSESDEDFALEYIAIVSDIDEFPGVSVNSPAEDTMYPNGTSSVLFEYEVDAATPTSGKFDVQIKVNGVLKTSGITTNGSYTVLTEDNTLYTVEIIALVDGFIVDSSDTFFTVGTPVLSISKNQIEGFKIYPNPVQDKFFVSSSNNYKKQVQLYNNLGKLVLSTTTENYKSISTKNINPGIYILKVTENNSISTKKLIIE